MPNLLSVALFVQKYIYRKDFIMSLVSSDMCVCVFGTIQGKPCCLQRSWYIKIYLHCASAATEISRKIIGVSWWEHQMLKLTWWRGVGGVFSTSVYSTSNILGCGFIFLTFILINKGDLICLLQIIPTQLLSFVFYIVRINLTVMM